jgi:hypothetical protein
MQLFLKKPLLIAAYPAKVHLIIVDADPLVESAGNKCTFAFGPSA